MLLIVALTTELLKLWALQAQIIKKKSSSREITPEVIEFMRFVAFDLCFQTGGREPISCQADLTPEHRQAEVSTGGHRQEDTF